MGDELRAPEVALIPPDPDHAATYFRWRQEQSFLENNPARLVGPQALAAQLQMAGCDLKNHHANEYRWFVTWRGELTGTVSLKNVSWDMQHGEIGYHIAEAFQGKGIARRAVIQLLDRIFGESSLVRVTARVSVDNKASERLARKLGFVEEGRLRSHVVIDERRYDQWLFGMLKTEWAAHRLRLEDELR